MKTKTVVVVIFLLIIVKNCNISKTIVDNSMEVTSDYVTDNFVKSLHARVPFEDKPMVRKL